MNQPDYDPTNSAQDAEDSNPDYEQLEKVRAQEGFVINSDAVKEATSTVVEALSSPDINTEQRRALWREYALVVEEFVESQASSERPKLQIAAIINKANIFLQLGDITRYLEELDNADMYATNMGFDKLCEAIDTKIKNGLDGLELTPNVLILKLREVKIIDDSDREYLRDQAYSGADLEDCLGLASIIIFKAGGNPEEILVSAGILEQ